jgi:dipeptidase E
MIKLLLTDSGVTNRAIHEALVGMLGKPIAECNVLCIPTAGYGHPHGTPHGAYRFISGHEPRCPMTELGWKSVGVLELTALPSLVRERWTGWIEASHALLVNGGDALYLAHWMRESGLADLLPSMDNKVWVGLSGGSMVMTPRIGMDFVGWNPPSGGDQALGIVDFSIFPHVGAEGCDWNTWENAEKWATEIGSKAYATDIQTAFKIVDGTVEVISEGSWKLFNG